MGYKLKTVLMNLIYPYFQQGEKSVTNFLLRNRAWKPVMASKWLLPCLVSKSDMGTSSKMSVWSLLQELLTAASPLAPRINVICCIKSASVVALLSHSARFLAAKSSMWCLAEFSVLLHSTTPAVSSWHINEAGQQWHLGFEGWQKQHVQITGVEYSVRQ